MLTCQSLTVGYQNKPLLSGLELQLRPAELVCLIGPNGAGKSTLLRTLAGMQIPLTGEVWLDGQCLRKMPATEQAKRLAIVLTSRVEAGNLSAYALVSLGRHPYTDWLGRLRANDEAVIQRVMTLTGCLSLAARPIHELSDGERQKVMIARALAQEPRILLLDEPTAFLDLPRRVELLLLLKKLARETGCAILLSTHDLDLALRIADTLWLLSSDHQMSIGLPEELALNGALARTFQGEGVDFDHASGGFRVYQPVLGPISLRGQADGVATAWTWRALERLGYEVSNGGIRHARHVEILPGPLWRIDGPQASREFASLSGLVAYLMAETK